MKTWVWVALGIAAAAGLLLVAGYLGLLDLLGSSREPFTPAIFGDDGQLRPESIAVIEMVQLGGVEQAITIRGADRANPVLLHLHGGPGVPSSPWATWNDYYSGLEEDFVLVHWDQRGAGKSYSEDLAPEDLTVAALVEDALELARILRERFAKERILLWGHSWGSGLGFEILRVDTEPFHAFIASAVRPTWDGTQILGYEKVLDLARQAEDKRAIRELESVQPFDPADPGHLALRGKYLTRFLVGEFRTEGMEGAWLGYVFRGRSPEYPSSLIGQTESGIGFSRATLGLEAMHSGYDHALDFPESSIPVYFLHGRYDYECPGELAFEYYRALTAPAKDFVWFEDSAHDLHFDEPVRFAAEVRRIADEVIEATGVSGDGCTP